MLQQRREERIRRLPDQDCRCRQDGIPEKHSSNEEERAITDAAENCHTNIGQSMFQPMVVIEVNIPGRRGNVPEENKILQKLAGHEDRTGGKQACQEFSGGQHFTAHGRKEIEMQAPVENLPAKQVHENAQTAEEHREPEKKELKDTCERGRFLCLIAALLNLNAVDRIIGQANEDIVGAIGIAILVVPNHSYRLIAAAS